MKGLFGTELPTPQAVRSSINQGLFNNLPQYGGTFGPAYTGMSRIGALFGSALAGQSPQEKQAQMRQQIGQQVVDELGLKDISDPMQANQLYRAYANALHQAGDTEGAMAAAKMVDNSMIDVSEGTQTDIRKNIVSQRTKLEEKASTMIESMKRIQSLAISADEGNRSARGTMVQQVARLAQGAGVITDRDAAAVTGDQNGFAYLISAILPGVNADTQAALRGIDPLGPGFNADNLLTVANSLLTSGRDSVNNRINDLRDQATEAKLRPQGIKALFAGSRNLNDLNRLGNEQRPPDVEQALWDAMSPLDRLKVIRAK